MPRFFTALALCSASMLSAGQETPAKLLEQPTFMVGPSATQIFAGGTFFHLAGSSTLKELPERMRQMVPQLAQALAAAGLVGMGPIHVVYHNMTPDPTKPFALEVGVLVPEGAKASGPAQVRTLQPFKCATILFTGPFEKLDKAYEVLFPALLASGKVPTQESRQMILYWENETSANNMALVQVGIR